MTKEAAVKDQAVEEEEKRKVECSICVKSHQSLAFPSSHCGTERLFTADIYHLFSQINPLHFVFSKLQAHQLHLDSSPGLFKVYTI